MHISTEQMLACKPSGSLEIKARAIKIYTTMMYVAYFKKKKERLHTSKRQGGIPWGTIVNHSLQKNRPGQNKHLKIKILLD